MTTITSFWTTKVDEPYQEPRLVKQLLPKKWKLFMLELLAQMKSKYTNHEHLISDLTTIVSTIPDSSFVQATLQIQPFKPHFQEERLSQAQVTESTMAQTISKAARFQCQPSKTFAKNVQKQRTTQKTLKHHFNKEFHPFRFIFKNFGRLLELKYKQIIEMKKMKVSEVQKLLQEDLNVFRSFFISSSKPYKKLFKIEFNQEEKKCQKKLEKFMQTYFSEHSKLNNSIHKIMTYATRSQLSSFFSQKIPDFVDPSIFGIPKDFQIDGCYIRSMNSLMEFSTGSNPEQSLNKLGQFRANILKDIDQYYSNKDGECKQLEMSAQIQIEVIRFIVAKLKGWCCEIYAQLRFLELTYGDEQIAFKYEQLSFMYTQLSFAFEIIENE